MLHEGCWIRGCFYSHHNHAVELILSSTVNSIAVDPLKNTVALSRVTVLTHVMRPIGPELESSQVTSSVVTTLHFLIQFDTLGVNSKTAALVSTLLPLRFEWSYRHRDRIRQKDSRNCP